MSLDEVLFHLKEYNLSYARISVIIEKDKKPFFGLATEFNGESRSGIAHGAFSVEECMERTLAELERRKLDEQSS